MTKDWIKKHQDSESSWESGQKKQSTGRPKVPEDKKRKPRFTVNLTDEEFSEIQAAAEKEGISQAAYVRAATLKKARER